MIVMKKCLYSEILDKYFEDTEEGLAKLTTEEKEYHDKVEAEENKKKARADRAHEIEEAFKTASEAFEKYSELKSQFIKDYGSFHMTIKNPGKHFGFGDGIVEMMFDPFFR